MNVEQDRTPLTAAVSGVGSRGRTYALCGEKYPEKMRTVAAAEKPRLEGSGSVLLSEVTGR